MGEKKKSTENGGGGGKSNVTVVLKADLHCEGCVTKVLKCIRSFDGVDSASIGGEQKITVVGKVDPMKLRDKVEKKMHKKFELISPQQKKENDDSNNNKKENAEGKENSGNAKQEKKKKKDSDDKNSNNESSGTDKKNKSNENEKQQQELPVTTAVLKVHLHCEGCIQKISKTVTKTKGYQYMKIDKEKDLVTVTGAMDMRALVQVLKKLLKKDVEIEILPPKKDGVEKKEKSGGGEKQKKSGNEKGKSVRDKGKGGGGEKNTEASNKVVDQIQCQVMYPNPSPYGAGIVGAGEQSYFHYYHYCNPYEYAYPHAPQLFSDENPNACTVM